MIYYKKFFKLYHLLLLFQCYWSKPWQNNINNLNTGEFKNLESLDESLFRISHRTVHFDQGFDHSGKRDFSTQYTHIRSPTGPPQFHSIHPSSLNSNDWHGGYMMENLIHTAGNQNIITQYPSFQNGFGSSETGMTSYDIFNRVPLIEDYDSLHESSQEIHHHDWLNWNSIILDKHLENMYMDTQWKNGNDVVGRIGEVQLLEDWNSLYNHQMHAHSATQIDHFGQLHVDNSNLRAECRVPLPNIHKERELQQSNGALMKDPVIPLSTGSDISSYPLNNNQQTQNLNEKGFSETHLKEIRRFHKDLPGWSPVRSETPSVMQRCVESTPQSADIIPDVSRRSQPTRLNKSWEVVKSNQDMKTILNKRKRTTKIHRTQSLPIATVQNLRERGEYLAEPLLPRGEMDRFFEMTLTSVMAHVSNFDPKHINLTKMAIDKARLWVSRRFLGSLQMVHEYQINSKDAQLNSFKAQYSIPLQVLIKLGWDVLKEIIGSWKDIKVVHRGISIFEPFHITEPYEEIDFDSDFSVFRYLLHLETENDQDTTDHYLDHLFKKWNFCLLEKNQKYLSSSGYLNQCMSMFKIQNVQMKEVNPCLNIVKVTGKNDIDKITSNLQKRGKFMVDALLPNLHIEGYFQQIMQNVCGKYKGLEKKIPRMINVGLSRLEAWVTHRFLGALQMIYVHDQEIFPASSQDTLQGEIRKGWEFLKKIFDDINLVDWPLTDIGFFDSKGSSGNLGGSKWGDISEVFKFYIQSPRTGTPPNQYLWYLIGRYFSTTVDPSGFESKLRQQISRDMVKTCYVSAFCHAL